MKQLFDIILYILLTWLSFFVFFSFFLEKKIEKMEEKIDYLTNLTCRDYLGIMTITAYTNHPEETDDKPNETASGGKVRDGIVAISQDLRNELKFGDEILIEGLGIFEVDDLLHERKKKQIDIFMFDRQEAKKFGRKNLAVYRMKK